MTNTETDLKPEPKCRWCNGDLLISKDLESVIHPNHLLWSACCTNEDCAFSYKETRGYDRKTDLLADLTRATPDHGLDKAEALSKFIEYGLKYGPSNPVKSLTVHYKNGGAWSFGADVFEQIVRLSSPVVGNAVNDGPRIKKWREWWQGSGEVGYHIFEIDDLGRNVREIAYYQYKDGDKISERESRIISHMVMVHNDRVDEATTPISSEKDENAQPFQCPEGLTCSGDGWDCIGDGLCEKDGNADGVEDLIASLRKQADQYYCSALDIADKNCRGEEYKITNGKFSVDDLNWHRQYSEKIGIHHGMHKVLNAITEAQTPPAAGWQIPDGEILSYINTPCGQTLEVCEKDGAREYWLEGELIWRPAKVHRVALQMAILEEDRIRYSAPKPDETSGREE